jgi:hypothetical protein
MSHRWTFAQGLVRKHLAAASSVRGRRAGPLHARTDMQGVYG